MNAISCGKRTIFQELSSRKTVGLTILWKVSLRFSPVVHFTVACLVAKPLNRSEAKGDLVMLQTLLLFKYRLLCYHANEILVPITTRSPSASLQIKGLATTCKYTTVKWPILYGIFMIKWHFKNVGDVVSVSHCGGLGSRPGPIQVIVFYVWAKILNFHSTSLCLGVWMGTGEFSGNPDEMLRGNLTIDWHPILGGGEGGSSNPLSSFMP